MREGSSCHRMLTEMLEQPTRLAQALDAARPIAARLEPAVREARGVILLGRGSSRSACTYGAWALQHFAGRPAWLASPAELAWGDYRFPLEQALVIAVSQSGESPEMVAAAHAAVERGATVLAVTNVEASPLEEVVAGEACVLRCHAGPERAIPATKSVTTAMACLLALATAGTEALDVVMADLPTSLEEVLTSARYGPDLSGLDGLVLVGEGPGVAVADEGAIKFREITRLPTMSMETSEFLHGSINAAGPGLGVITLALDALSGNLSQQVIDGARRRGAMTVSVAPDRVAGADVHLPLPDASPAIGAFLALGELQRVARDTGLALGVDPDEPAGLQKVTRVSVPREP
jgi:glutamine---fructose-6-phosphate transaminase (isomerizing)